MFLDFPVRGIDGILAALPVKETYTNMKEDGSIAPINTITINVEGHNLKDILKLQVKYNSELDFDAITCNNPQLVYEFFGKTSAKKKLFNEIKVLFQGSIDVRHINLICSIMTQTPYISSIEQSGLKERNPDNDLLVSSLSRHATTLL